MPAACRKEKTVSASASRINEKTKYRIYGFSETPFSVLKIVIAKAVKNESAKGYKIFNIFAPVETEGPRLVWLRNK